MFDLQSRLNIEIFFRINTGICVKTTHTCDHAEESQLLYSPYFLTVTQTDRCHSDRVISVQSQTTLEGV